MAKGPITQDNGALILGLLDIRVGNSAANIATTSPVLTKADSMGAMAETSFKSEVEMWEHSSGFPLTKDTQIPTSETAMLDVTFEEITLKNVALAMGLDPSVAGTAFTGSGYTTVDSALGTYDVAKPIVGGVDAEFDTYTILFLTATTYDVISGKHGILTGVGDTTLDSAFTFGGSALFTISADSFTGTWAADDVFKFTMAKEGYDDPRAGSIKFGARGTPAYLRVEAVLELPDGSGIQTYIFPRAQISSNVELGFAADDNAKPAITIESSIASSETNDGDAVWDDMPLGWVVFEKL